MKKQNRVVVYIPEDDYNRLQSKLRLAGKTVSGWFREQVAKLLSE